MKTKFENATVKSLYKGKEESRLLTLGEKFCATYDLQLDDFIPKFIP